MSFTLIWRLDQLMHRSHLHFESICLALDFSCGMGPDCWEVNHVADSRWHRLLWRVFGSG